MLVCWLYGRYTIGFFCRWTCINPTATSSTLSRSAKLLKLSHALAVRLLMPCSASRRVCCVFSSRRGILVLECGVEKGMSTMSEEGCLVSRVSARRHRNACGILITPKLEEATTRLHFHSRNLNQFETSIQFVSGHNNVKLFRGYRSISQALQKPNWAQIFNSTTFPLHIQQ
jgi:hypothetical protein